MQSNPCISSGAIRIPATITACILAAVASVPVAAGADEVEWPAGFDDALSSKIEAMEPSGSQRGESAAVSWFDSVTGDEDFASIAELRNFVKPGFVLTFR